MKTKILIVDPSVDFHQTVELMLGHKHMLTHSYTMNQAQVELNRDLYDMVLMDVSLPDGDGIEFCAYIKTRFSKDISIIYVTENNSPENEVIAFSLGADDYILRPINSRRLRARINARLDRIIPASYKQTKAW